MTRRYLSMALMCCCDYAQTGSPLAFDAVWVKISRPQSPGTVPRIGCHGGPETKDPGLWICENVTLLRLLQLAYNVRAFQLELPDSVRGGFFEVAARVRPGASREQFRVMVQGLLAERFHLTFHWDTRELRIYDLTVGKGGAKVKESSNQDEEEPPLAASGAEVKLPKPKLGEDGYPVVPPEFSGVTTMTTPDGAAHARFQALHKTMEDLAGALTIRLDRPVVDKTGLTGFYDISLYWELDPLPGRPAPLEPRPSLEAAVREQLGLRLVGDKGDFRVLVIDHVDNSPPGN